LFAVIAARRKIIFVAFGAVEFLITNGKLQLSQRFIALGAVEAGGMPVTIVVLQVLRIHVSAQYQPAYNIDVKTFTSILLLISQVSSGMCL